MVDKPSAGLRASGGRGRSRIRPDIPPNLAADVVRGKIRLVGGGALLPGLAARIEAAAGIPAVVVDDPLHCTVRGAADALEPGAGLTFTERPDTAGYLAPAANENPVL